MEENTYKTEKIAKNNHIFLEVRQQKRNKSSQYIWSENSAKGLQAKDKKQDFPITALETQILI